MFTSVQILETVYHLHKKNKNVTHANTDVQSLNPVQSIECLTEFPLNKSPQECI